MRLRTFLLAAGALALSAGAAGAATVTNDLNLRTGPGTGYRVITAMPAGAYVDVLNCGGAWCRVDWRGTVGYASASYLAGGGYAAVPPPPVYYAPPTTVFRLGFGTGPRWHHRGWRGGHRSHHNRGHHRGGHHRRH